MKVLLSWVREFVDIDESAEAIGRKLSLRGLALDGLEPHGTDALLDVDVTANRPDCLSMAGIAREIAVAQPMRAHRIGRVGRSASDIGIDGLTGLRDEDAADLEPTEYCLRES